MEKRIKTKSKPKASASATAVASARDGVAGTPLSGREWLVLGVLLLLGLCLRVVFMPFLGHATDIGTFEAWLIALANHGTKSFYSETNFVDYPPGYMFVLWIFGQIYNLSVAAFGGVGSIALMVIIKAPAVLADIGIGYLTYLIARRTWASGKAFLAVAIIAFNPAVWFVSAYWGQADSVAAIFLVWALYLAVTERFEWAWAALSVAVLIKPQPLVVWPMLLFWQVRRQGWTWRLALIPLIGLVVGYVGSLPFSPGSDPAGVWQWLYLRYHTGTQVYPYNSANAFNLYSIARDMWQSDTARIFGIQQWVLGVILFVSLSVAITMRQWRLTGPGAPANGERAVYAAWFLALLGLFILTTRMHERYMFSALAVAPLLWNMGRTQRIGIVVLSITFVINLIYALEYLQAPSADLNPLLVHSLSFVNVLCLFVLAGAYLIEEMGVAVEQRLTGVRPDGAARAASAATRRARRSPLAHEGLIGWTRFDYLIAAGLTIAAGVLLFYGLGIPNSRIFDEVYFARAAQEYVRHQSQFEWTHPPLTKLIMAASAGLFRALPDPLGARLASAAFGTLTVPLLYGFAKRLFSSTGAAVVSVFLLMTSGYWFVHSRIAAPYIFEAFFSLLVYYSFYRLLISSQIVRRENMLGTTAAAAVIWPILTMLALVFAVLIHNNPNDVASLPGRDKVFGLVVVMAAIGVYYVVRAVKLLAPARVGVIYPDGSSVEGNSVSFASGERLPLKSATIVDGDQTTKWRQDGVDIAGSDASVTWNSNCTITATSPAGTVVDRQRWLPWFVLAAFSVACLVTCKWEGVMGLIMLWFAASFVAAQRWFPLLWKPAQDGPPARFVWGNPFGMRWGTFIGASIAITVVVYLLSYIPFFSTGDTYVVQGKSWPALWELQKQMYWYHHNLNATHPYASKWWTWPLELRPVSYYFQTFTPPGVNPSVVGEVIALPNPFVWLMGLITVPFAGWYAWRERHKGMALLVVAYLFQWLPWALSPRIDFEYNFYPNLAIICLCGAYVLGTWWMPAVNPTKEKDGQLASTVRGNRMLIGAYLAICLWGFVYFFPIYTSMHIPYAAWIARMWLPYGVPHWYGWI